MIGSPRRSFPVRSDDHGRRLGRDGRTVLNHRWILEREAFGARRPDLRQPVFVLIADEHERRLVADRIASPRHRQRNGSAAVHSRVDGQLLSVRYREGEVVHKGDVLVEIDDKPYQAALTQAEGQLLRDQASLENARLDLARYQELVPLKAIPEQQLATQQATVHQYEGLVKVDSGQIESARVNLAYCQISAPIAETEPLRRNL